jgi:hypothetical protein
MATGDLLGLGMDAATGGILSGLGGLGTIFGGFFGGEKQGQIIAQRRSDLTQGFQGMSDIYNPWMNQMSSMAQPYISGAANAYGQLGNMLQGQNPFSNFNVANAVRGAGAGQAAAGNLLSGQGSVARQQAGLNMGNQMQQQWIGNLQNYMQTGLNQENQFQNLNTGMTSQLGGARMRLGEDLSGVGANAFNPWENVGGAFGGALMNYGIMTAPQQQPQTNNYSIFGR